MAHQEPMVTLSKDCMLHNNNKINTVVILWRQIIE